jgi:hypothetical protein
VQYGSRHARQTEHQPYQPDEQAEAVEIAQLPLIFTDKDQRGSQYVAEHEHDRQHTGDAVSIKIQSACDFAHQGRTGGVKNQADPEQENMAQFEPSGEFLIHTPGV